MINVLYQPLPTEWEGYKVNTDFRIGIQISLLLDDDSVTPYEKAELVLELLFCNDDGSIRPYPSNEKDIGDLLTWFMSGWNTDNTPEDAKRQKIMDYNKDQWRIYADFMQIYHIDLNSIEYLHFWAFMAMLWSMPGRLSSFLQVIEIRQREIKPKMGREEKAAITKAQRIYAIKQPKQEKELTDEQNNKIDDFDKLRSEQMAKKVVRDKIASDFMR